MKKYIFSLVLLALSLNLHAQEWSVCYKQADGIRMFMDYKTVADGKRDIEGREYLPLAVSKMELTTSGGYELIHDIVADKDTLYYRTEGDKILLRHTDKAEDIALPDFGLKENDVFVDYAGEEFTVTWAGSAEELGQNLYTQSGETYDGKELRMLRLRSQKDGREETWVEGIGSIGWGILPSGVATEIGLLDAGVSESSVVSYKGEYRALFDIKDDGYKLALFAALPLDRSEEGGQTFEFVDDTLRVYGVVRMCRQFNGMVTEPSFYECLIREDNSIYVQYWGIDPIITASKDPYYFDVKIPGFKAGTYHIGTLELVCNGAKAETVTYPTIYSEHQQEAWDKLKSRGVTDDAVPTTNYWQVYCVDVDGKFTTLEYAATLRKTTMEGREYLKVGVGKTDTLLYRQEGNKVFMLQDGRELLLLDYALGVGETFTDPWGKRLTVKEAMVCEPYYSYLRYFQQGVATFMSKEKPRILRLESEDGLYTDEWIEGIGSTQWGIVPLPVLQTLVACPIGTKWVHIDQASTLSMSAYLDTYEDSYKRAYFVPGYGITESFEQERGFHFVNDTLYVTDRAWLNTGVCYAECKVEGNTVDITTQMTMPETTGMGNHAFVVKFPGFKPGTYEISLNGQEPVTLACNGATADYHPFIEVGKIWKSTITSIVPSEDVPNYRTTERTYTLGKDTLIEGRNCIAIKGDYPKERYIYEDGRKVYCYNTENGKFYLIYDFGCQVGDKFAVVNANGTMEMWDEVQFTCTVKEVDTVKTKEGTELRRITLCAVDISEEETTETWIEGIGSIYGPLRNVGAMLYIGGHEELDSCEVSNQLLYPLSQSTGIHTTNLTPQTESQAPLYDLSGRRIVTPRRGLYIKNGKKVVVR